ncbi:YhgE/Pip domain-containing protein [Ectobacillus antri]|jgi:putative membrane protein|uniref:YhgE/Pip domain-containing protein n=1 Tax=Ectobacillus antri TaxID=2486280 RepID=A0ABT6H5L6_9BACI|nr:YhgE/Pip domain-containing protein [Ectobacillus antri]MDG4656725.1 YhgE/Pip domain-containing protein [Ectobacillus antri]MDG5753912.1 YhgE/Pip domain-containing protein [Ectobacillus antri]
MRGLTLLKKEFLAIVKNKKLLIPLLGVLFIPVLYAGMFLWAFWDPYEQLNDLPVAVVNMDEGAAKDGENLQVGNDLIKELKENDNFKWEFVSEAEAKKGMDDRKYYMTVRIPENFSRNATTLLDTNPEKLELEYIPNESLNFLSSQIGGTAIDKLKQEVANTVSKTYAEKVFADITKVSDGLAQAADGANKLRDGSQTLTDKLNEVKDGVPKLYNGAETITNKLGELKGGATQLYTGSQTLTDKLNEVKDGVPKLYDGAQTITNKLDELKGGAAELYTGSQTLASKLSEVSQGAPQLYAGSQTITKGASDLAAGMPAFQTGAEKLSKGAAATAEGAKNIGAGLEALNQKMNELPEPYKTEMQKAVQQLIEGNKQVIGGAQTVSEGNATLAQKTTAISQGANQLAAGSGQLTEKLSVLNQGAPQLAEGAVKLSDGLGKLAAGSSQLAAGSSQLTEKLGGLKDGAPQLANGAVKLSDGLDKLVSGSGQLAAGSGQLTEKLGGLKDGAPLLADGSKQILDGQYELASKLGDAAKETGEVKTNENTYDMFADPVRVKTEKVAEVPNYGTGFTPYFLSLGLFVGALLLSIVFPLRETVGEPKSGFSWFISKFGILLGVGIIQALVADLILFVGLDIEVKSVPYFILFSILTSLTFIALVQFLVTAFSDAGRFMAIIVLILQLTTSAGTFPIELVPKALQVFNAWLPMTYSVSGFKAVISSGDFGFMWQNAAILGAYIGVMALGTIVTLTIIHKRYFGRMVDTE